MRLCYHIPKNDLCCKKFPDDYLHAVMLIGKWLHLKHVYFIHVYFSPVAEGVTAINQAIDAQDERLLMAALTYPRASIYGVTSKCIQEYLEELKKLKDSKKEAGQ